MGKEDNFYSFWHKEIVPAESCRKRRKNKKGKKLLSIPEKLRTSGEKKTFPEEKKEDLCKIKFYPLREFRCTKAARS